jgi:pimeloyl-ACP methyl ester carboxylesterase
MRLSMIFKLTMVCGLSGLPTGLARAQDTGPEGGAASGEESTESRSPVVENLPVKTLGGRQLWGDVQCFHDWRIQHCLLDGHYRLLDGRDVRHAWGTLEQCQTKLEQIRQEQDLAPMSGRAVICLHGIVRSSKSFGAMKSVLRDAGYVVFGFDYPSTQVEIPASAEYLHKVIESLEGITEINFVTHSMGGLVVRAYLKEHSDPRIRRMVMLGVPNQGARMATLLQKNILYRTLYGPAGLQLVDDPEGLIAKLPVPQFEFAIVAGARGNEQGFNPLIPGDDDGTVSLESACLPGAADFMTVRAMHSFLMYNPEVVASSARFLQTGRLRAEGEAQPIPPAADDEAEPPAEEPQHAAPASQ